MQKKSMLSNSALIEKRNVLNEIRSTNMTLQELRFFSIYLSKINPRDINTRKVRFPLEDFQRIMEFGRLNIRQLKASTDGLLCKIVHLPLKSGGYDSFQLFKRCRVDRDENYRWWVEIDAHDDALPLMFDFKDRYFKYELWNALRLRSSNQIRMYEILKQYEKIGRRELAVQELRELLGIAPNEYPQLERFKTRVLDSCQKALKENTDICYTYERGQTGRNGKWLTIVFHITKNTNYVDQLTLEEFINLQSTSANASDEDFDERENICAGFADSEFADFSIDELKELKELAWPLKEKETVDRYNEDLDNKALACEYATSDFLKRIVLSVKARPNVFHPFSYIKKILANRLDDQNQAISG